tara:strand:- start:328 stop:756 length:429 start_codon:yes stop_codon:yes gene_type:complete
LDLEILAFGLERLHLQKLLDRVFYVEGLDSLFEVVRLDLSEVKKIVHEEMKDVCRGIQNALGRTDLLEIVRHRFYMAQSVGVVALLDLRPHRFQSFLDLLDDELDVLVLKKYRIYWVPHLVGDSRVNQLLELDLSFHLVVKD